MSEKMTQTGTDISNKTPGRLLKAAREKLELTPKDIAAQLNLQINTIIALENDDEEKLPVSTYVRGYIRSYARIVNLNADTLIKLYESGALPPPEIIPDVKQHTQISSRDKPVKAVTYLVTFGLALLLIAWLQSHYVVDQAKMTADTSTQGEKHYGGSLNYPIKIVIHPDTPFLDKAYYDALENSSELPLYVDEPETSGNLTDILDVPGSLSIDTTISEPTNDDNVLPGTDQVSFIITKESWIKIQDSANKVMYMDTARPGERVDLSGEAPFSVILGYSPGVQVTFNGKQFNTEPYSIAGVARFTLGE